MVLITGVVDGGVRIGLVDSLDDFDIGLVSAFNIPSEMFLEEIERVVGDAGGWSVVDSIGTSVSGESFTSVRGLVVLVNALAELRGLSVCVFSDDFAKCEDVELPLVPEYSQEPNISVRKK